MEVMSLGEKIKTIRKSRKMTMKDLADAKASTSQISQIEAGKSNPSLDLLYHIARRLGISPGELVQPEEYQADRLFDHYFRLACLAIDCRAPSAPGPYLEKLADLIKDHLPGPGWSPTSPGDSYSLRLQFINGLAGYCRGGGNCLDDLLETALFSHLLKLPDRLPVLLALCRIFLTEGMTHTSLFVLKRIEFDIRQSEIPLSNELRFKIKLMLARTYSSLNCTMAADECLDTALKLLPALPATQPGQSDRLAALSDIAQASFKYPELAVRMAETWFWTDFPSEVFSGYPHEQLNHPSDHPLDPPDGFIPEGEPYRPDRAAPPYLPGMGGKTETLHRELIERLESNGRHGKIPRLERNQPGDKRAVGADFAGESGAVPLGDEAEGFLRAYMKARRINEAEVIFSIGAYLAGDSAGEVPDRELESLLALWPNFGTTQMESAATGVWAEALRALAIYCQNHGEDKAVLSLLAIMKKHAIDGPVQIGQAVQFRYETAAAIQRGDLPGLNQLEAQGLALREAQTPGRPEDAVGILLSLADIYHCRGNREGAESCLLKAAAAAEGCTAARCLNGFFEVIRRLLLLGRYGEAWKTAEQYKAKACGAGLRLHIQAACLLVCLTKINTGSFDDGEIRQTLDLGREFYNKSGIVGNRSKIMRCFGFLYYRAGDMGQSAACFEAADFLG